MSICKNEIPVTSVPDPAIYPDREDNYPRVADPLGATVTLTLRDILARIGESATLAIIDADKVARIARATQREDYRAGQRADAIRREGRAD